MEEKKLVTSNPFGEMENREKAKPRPKHKEEPLPVVEPEPIEEVPVEEATVNLLAGLTDKKPESKSYSIYLDTDLVAEVDKIAKQNKTNRSKVINTLLRNGLNK